MNRNEVVNEKKNNIVYFFNQIPILIKINLSNWMPYQLTLRLMSLKRQKKKNNTHHKYVCLSNFEKNKCWWKSAFLIDRNCFNQNIH